MGFIMRDHNGLVVVASSRQIRGLFDPEVAESIALCYGLQLQRKMASWIWKLSPMLTGQFTVETSFLYWHLMLLFYRASQLFQLFALDSVATYLVWEQPRLMGLLILLLLPHGLMISLIVLCLILGGSSIDRRIFFDRIASCVIYGQSLFERRFCTLPDSKEIRVNYHILLGSQKQLMTLFFALELVDLVVDIPTCQVEDCSCPYERGTMMG